MTPSEKIKSLGIELPDVPKPLGNYVPLVRAGNLVFLSGMLPLKDGKLIKTGRAGAGIDTVEAANLARQAAINALAVVDSFVGLDSIKRCVKITGYVASADDYYDQPKVVNGASDLMADVFGESGRHARAAVGVNALPMNSPVEIEFIFEMKDGG